eukprot:m51a1_g4764 hypothetical protein (466) ;mRNA; r:4623-6562
MDSLAVWERSLAPRLADECARLFDAAVAADLAWLRSDGPRFLRPDADPLALLAAASVWPPRAPPSVEDVYARIADTRPPFAVPFEPLPLGTKKVPATPKTGKKRKSEAAGVQPTSAAKPKAPRMDAAAAPVPAPVPSSGAPQAAAADAGIVDARLAGYRKATAAHQSGFLTGMVSALGSLFAGAAQPQQSQQQQQQQQTTTSSRYVPTPAPPKPAAAHHLPPGTVPLAALSSNVVYQGVAAAAAHKKLPAVAPQQTQPQAPLPQPQLLALKKAAPAVQAPLRPPPAPPAAVAKATLPPLPPLPALQTAQQTSSPAGNKGNRLSGELMPPPPYTPKAGGKTSSVMQTPPSTASPRASSVASKLSVSSSVSSASKGYELSPYHATDDEYDSEEEKERKATQIPRWAKGERLEAALARQENYNTDEIFPAIPKSCDLDMIFANMPKRKKKYNAHRGSSGNWDKDGALQ